MILRTFKVLVVSLLVSNFLTLAGQTPSANANALQELVSSNLITISMDIPEAELLNKSGEKPYRVASKLYVKVAVKNDSDQRIKIRVADRYYQNRPQLFRNGKLVPYRGGLAESLQRQEEYPGFVSLRHVVWVSPYSSEKLTEIDLNDWYGELEPGSYRLISRYRSDVRGPWTADSAPLLFQVVKH